MTITITKSEEKTVKANGIDITYDTFGNPADPALLLVMGLGMQMTSWDEALCAQFADAGFWVIRFDNRDVGRSTKFDKAGPPNMLRMAAAGLLRLPMTAAYKLKDMAADAVGLLDVLGVTAAHVVGVSMGGMISQELAIRYPKRILSLTSIMSTTGDPNLPQPDLKMRLSLLKRAPAEETAYVNHMVNLIDTLYGPYYSPDEAKTRALSHSNFKRGYYPVGVTRQLAAIISSGNREQKLADLRVPTLVIHGDADPLVPVECGRATARAIPHAKLMIVPKMGHALPREVWAELVEAIVEHTRKTQE